MQTAITEQQVLEVIGSTKIVPVFYHDDLGLSQAMIKACYDGGIRVFEWVARGANAAAHFSKLNEFMAVHCKDMVLGAGTILTQKQAEAFIEMGASFLVSPVYNADVMDKAYYSKVPYLPGCFTPTEIFNAYNAGCTWVKVFPGNAVAPSYIKSIKDVMPEVCVMVTGGVKPEREDVQNWLSNGADAVGIGSQLFEALDYDRVRTKAAALRS